MDTIKSAIGLGKSEQQGQEPLSGEKGHGTAAAPYDQGNQHDDPSLAGKAAQEIARNTAADTPSSNPPGSEAATGTDEELGRRTGPSADTNEVGKSDRSFPSAESKKSKPVGNPTIGTPSWFKTALPLGKRKKSTSEKEPEPSTAAGHQQPSHPSAETSNLPSNHLGVEVPVGASGDLANHADTVDPTPTTDPNRTMSDGERRVENTASQSTADTAGMGGEDVPAKHTVGSRAHMAPAEKRDYSNAPLRPVEKAEAKNEVPSAIPTAGGIMLGAHAMEERKASVARRASSQVNPADLPPVDKDGSNDPVTAQNTVSNTTPGNVTSDSPGGAGAGTGTATESGIPAVTAASQSDGKDVRKSIDSSGRRSSATIEKIKGKLHIGKH